MEVGEAETEGLGQCFETKESLMRLSGRQDLGLPVEGACKYQFATLPDL